mgnify:CR=1 FL=1
MTVPMKPIEEKGLLPKDIMNTIHNYLERFPMDKKGREEREKYLVHINELIALASDTYMIHN